jgi:carbonic anhydrase/acetyltransferase-like protein (isoleucine patch superfamily)
MMLIEHGGHRPEIHPSASVAPNAVVCGNVTIGPHTRVLFGAVLTAEGGPIRVGAYGIVMEQAVVRGTARYPVTIGNHVLIGPHASLNGCTIEDNVFLATGCSVFNGARIGTRSEVRVNGIVQLRTTLPPDTTVPMGWVAVGDPAEVLPTEAHERIWAVQEPLNFPRSVFGLDRPAEGETIMPELTERYSRALASYRDDEIL